MFRLPFLEDTTPPPFYLPHLTDEERTRLDRWFIGHRSQAYYIKRFAEFDQKGKLHPRWHWSAFFTTFGWLLYRKRYLDCLVYCIAGWSFIKLNIVIILAICEFLFVAKMPEAWQIHTRVTIGLAVWVFWSGMVARWTDAYYYRMARREIADAVAWFDGDLPAQKAHLAKHGGTSIFGMAMAFGIFGAMLAIIVIQFVPLIAIKQEKAVIYDSYQSAHAIQKRVALIYENTKTCPTDMPVGSTHQKISVHLQDHLPATNTDCVIVATVSGATYPVRYLNGRALYLYHTTDKDGNSVWRCQSSLNKAQTPKSCIGG